MGSEKRRHTLVGDLEYRPQDLMPLLTLMRSVLCILHLVAELEQGIFDIIKAIWRWLATACRAYWRHRKVLWPSEKLAIPERGSMKPVKNLFVPSSIVFKVVS